MVMIPESVEELCDEFFHKCKGLLCLTFGESSSLKLIGELVFYGSGTVEIPIPEGIEELCEACFSECENLSRVTFGESYSLKLIGNWAFLAFIYRAFQEGVEGLCDEFFYKCKGLLCVTFGESSSLKFIRKGPLTVVDSVAFVYLGALVGFACHHFQNVPFCDSNCFFGVFDGLSVSKNQRVCYSCISELEALLSRTVLKSFVKSAFARARVHVLPLASACSQSSPQ